MLLPHTIHLSHLYSTLPNTNASILFHTTPRYILNMEWYQLSWERSILGMPFLDDEELPFLREFDDRPGVSLAEVLEILRPTIFS